MNDIGFGRLVAVETRKLIDTRTGWVLAAILAAVTVAAVVGRAVTSGPDLQPMVMVTGIGLSTLLPVLGILTMTGEWSHRTALTTFTLEPRRIRVLVAKCLPPTLFAVAISAVALGLAVPVAAIVAEVQGVSADWTLEPGTLLGWAGANVLIVLAGLAVGMLLLSAPAATVICLAAPMAWSVLTTIGGVAATVARWLNLGGSAAAAISDGTTVVEWAHLSTAVLAWILLPLLIGGLRIARKEVK